MLRSCRYCGRIHDTKVICPQMEKARRQRWQKNGSATDRFHASYRWAQKSLHIRERDHYLCLACLYGLDGKGSRITTADLSVHHIVPVSEAWDMRLDDDNLITLCAEHHERAEDGTISREELKKSVERGAGAGLRGIPPVSGQGDF